MKSLSWTIVVVLAIGWSCDVQCRSIDAPTTSSAITDAEQKSASDKLVDVAAEILTVGIIGDAVNKTLESEVQREATAKEQAIAQIMKLAETKAIKEILADASTTPTPTLGGQSNPTPSVVGVATQILTVKAIADALDKSLESQIQSEANAREKAIAQIMKLAETEAIKGILTSNLRTQPPPRSPTSNLNFPIPTLEFESGSGDNDNEISGTRDKRTVAQISRYATCLFTILVNPNCFNEIRNSGGGAGTARAGGLFAGLLGGLGGGSTGRSSSRSGSRQEAYNRQLRQWMEYQKRQIAKLNATEGGNYTTPFPILPPSPPPPEDEDTTPRPQGFIGRFIQWKLNAIPSLFRTIRSLFSSILPFIQNLGGNRGGGGGGGLAALFGGGGGSSGSGGFGNSYGSSSSSYGGSSSGSGSSFSSGGSGSSSLSSSGSSGSSGSDSSSGSGPETSTYRISLG